MPKIELYMPFESVLAEKKNMVNLGLKTAMLLFSNCVHSEVTLDFSIALQYHFVNEVISIPTINKYYFPLIAKFKSTGKTINFKNMF